MRCLYLTAYLTCSVLLVAARPLFAKESDSRLLRRRTQSYANDGWASFGQPEQSSDMDEQALGALWGDSIEANRIAARFLSDFSMVMPTSSSSPSPVPVDETSMQPVSMTTTTPTTSTHGPSSNCLAGTTREDVLLGMIAQVTNVSLLSDANTPQGQAFNWIVSEDPLNVDPCNYPTTEQRYGLATFYFSTTGDEWADSTGWLSEMEECDWFGINCTEGSNSYVTGITLEMNNLAGPLPNEISTLNQVQSLALSANAITSTIPTGIGALKGLKVLNLEDNLFSGSLFTPELLGLDQLEALGATLNNFTGSIPATISGLSNLKLLYLGGNNFAGSIPTEIGAMESLDAILLYLNGFTGVIPEEIGGIHKLTRFGIDNNAFDGTIPESLYSISTLTVLGLNLNRFEGTLSSSIGNLSKLSSLRVDHNALSGTLPSEIGHLTGLVNLVLNDQYIGFEGPVPDVFSDLTCLAFVDFSTNNFTGPLPQTLFDVATIKQISLANNSFTGTLPANYGGAGLLRALVLGNNLLTGTVPEISYGSLRGLSEFSLFGNSFTGSMPDSICQLRDSGNLNDLWADCGGSDPEITCDTPACCNRCFVDT